MNKLQGSRFSGARFKVQWCKVQGPVVSCAFRVDSLPIMNPRLSRFKFFKNMNQAKLIMISLHW